MSKRLNRKAKSLHYICTEWATKELEDRFGTERPSGSFYNVLDVPNKLVGYPGGRSIFVKSRKIRDTAGITFYTFDIQTPLK